MNPALLVIPVLLPLILGGIIPLLHFKNRKQREWYVLSVVLLNTIITWFFIWNLKEGDKFTALVMTKGLSIAFHMDGLSKVFAGLISGLWPFAVLYAFEYMRHEGKENYFFTFYTMTYGITMGVACAANVLTMYLFYEMLTLITMPLVMHYMDHKSIRAGIKYLKYSIGGAAFAFIGFVIINQYGSSCDFIFGGTLQDMAVKGHEHIVLIGYVMMFFGFGVKAAVFPFHGWLPDASVAPTPVTALLHAVAVVKSGVFAIIRVTYYSFGIEMLAGTWAQYLVMAFAIITIVYGSSMAVKEQHIKRRLAYSTVSNLSYILFGATIMTPFGFVGSLMHMVFHGIMKITLFFCAGAIMHQTKKEYIYELDGLAKKMPKVFGVFLFASASLIGVPPLVGFISKWKLATAALKDGSILGITGTFALLISAVLTAIYVFNIIFRAYYVDKDNKNIVLTEGKDPNWYLLVPLFAFCIAILCFSVYSVPFTNFVTQIAGLE